MYTQGGEYGTLDKVLIERNRITENGHADYEDGIVINGSGTGPISHVTIERNILDHNRYSGIRFAGGAQSDIVITKNTFAANGAGGFPPWQPRGGGVWGLFALIGCAAAARPTFSGGVRAWPRSAPPRTRSLAPACGRW